jgi:hypothetical protein
MLEDIKLLVQNSGHEMFLVSRCPHYEEHTINSETVALIMNLREAGQ